MKLLFFGAAMAAAFSFVGAASAAPSSAGISAGHYEWRYSSGYGPRAPITAPKRVWVSDSPLMANCDCDRMRANTADCMKPMHGMPSSVVSAG